MTLQVFAFGMIEKDPDIELALENLYRSNEQNFKVSLDTLLKLFEPRTDGKPDRDIANFLNTKLDVKKLDILHTFQKEFLQLVQPDEGFQSKYVDLNLKFKDAIDYMVNQIEAIIRKKSLSDKLSQFTILLKRDAIRYVFEPVIEECLNKNYLVFLDSILGAFGRYLIDDANINLDKLFKLKQRFIKLMLDYSLVEGFYMVLASNKIDLLVEFLARVDKPDRFTKDALIHAIAKAVAIMEYYDLQNQLVRVKALLNNFQFNEYQKYLNFVNQYKYTFQLIEIIKSNESDVKERVNQLLDKGALINGNDLVGDNLLNTPLIEAVESKNYDLVKLLVNKGADVNLSGNLGYTPLMIALQKKNFDIQIVKFLLEHGADKTVKNIFGRDASRLAWLLNDPTINELFDVDVNVDDEQTLNQKLNALKDLSFSLTSLANRTL